MSKNGSVTLENSKGSLLKKKYNAALSKPYMPVVKKWTKKMLSQKKSSKK